MGPYADTPGRFVRQVVGDLVVAGWVAAWVWVAMRARELVLRLAAPGRATERAGSSFRDALDHAGDTAHRVPVVGGPLRDALRSAGSAGSRIAAAGQAEQATVGHIALGALVVLITLPTVMALALWLPGRVRWIREAGATRKLLRAPDDPDGADLLALRALAGQSPRRLRAAAGEGAVTAWRRGDDAVIARLAALQARSLGLRAPRRR
jgi:hypothetical protein